MKIEKKYTLLFAALENIVLLLSSGARKIATGDINRIVSTA
jgi:hypothetical protein